MTNTQLAGQIFLIFGIAFSLKAQDLHSLSEIIDIMEKSTLSYEIAELKEKIPPPNNRLNLNTADVYISTENEMTITKQVELSDELKQLKAEAETYFEKKEWAKARESYLKIYSAVPEYSKMSTYVGQTFEYEDQLDSAMVWYKKSIENNYIDYMAHWFLGRLYLEAGNTEKGTAELFMAHVFNRNHPYLTQELALAFKLRGMDFNYQWTFTPQIKLTQPTDKSVKLEMVKDWLGYGLVKSVWVYETDYRKSMGVEETGVSMLEEREALLGLYVGIAENQKVMESNPAFRALGIAFDKELVDEYILYEILLVKYPAIAYQLSGETLSNLAGYAIRARCTELKTPKKGKKKKKKKK